jgi:hypothetical protein
LYSVLKFIYIGEEPNEDEKHFKQFKELAKHLAIQGFGEDQSSEGN